jgi:type II secretory pathway component PulM
MSKKHEDTKVSLHPLSFEEAIKELARTPKHRDLQAEESDNTTKDAPGSASFSY